MKRKTILLVAVVALLSFPLVYLFVRSASAPPLPAAPAPLPPATDITSLEQQVKNDPSFDNLLNLSMAYINGGSPGKSIDLLKRAISLQPNSAIAYNNLGVAYTMLMQYQNGIDACSKALAIDSSFQLAKNNLNWANDEKRKVLLAIDSIQHLPEEKHVPEQDIELGLCYFKIGDYDRSITIWNKLAEGKEKNTIALNNIGTAFMMKGQVADAIAIFKQVLTLKPDDQLAKNNLNWAMEEQAKLPK